MPAKFHPNASSGESSLSRIEGFYTQAILSGKLQEGERLPPSDEIARIWSASGTIVQKAMQRLAAAGLVERVRRSGTIVRSRQERAVVALIFGTSVSEVTAASKRLLMRHIEKHLAKRHLACRIYDSVNLKNADASDMVQLLKSDLVYYNFKGVIAYFAGDGLPKELLDADLPTVVVSNDRCEVRGDHRAFVNETLEFLRARKRQRVVFCVMQGVKQSQFLIEAREQLRTYIEGTKGMEVEVVQIPTDRRGYCFEAATFEVVLEMAKRWKENPESMPDALVISDEVAARGACMALLKMQIEPSDAFDLVVRTSDSIEIFYGMPVHTYKQTMSVYAKEISDLLWRKMTKGAIPKLPVIIKGRIEPHDAPSKA